MAPDANDLVRIGLRAAGVIDVAMGVVSARVAFLGAKRTAKEAPGASGRAARERVAG